MRHHHRGLIIAAALVAGCSFDSSGPSGIEDSGPPGDAADSEDAAVDGAQSDPCTETCAGWGYTPTNYVPCAGDERVGGEWELSAGLYVVNTGDGTLTEPDGGVVPTCGSLDPQSLGPLLRTVTLERFVLPADSILRVEGPHPLLIAVHGSATLDGIVEASAIDRGNGIFDPGPGAGDTAVCGAGQGEDGTAGNSGGGGGAGGGGFGRRGGDGTQGGNGGARGDHGMALIDDSLEPLRGGCAGGAGGGSGGSSGGTRGGAGGAIQIAAKDSLTVSGTIRASGGGGQGAGDNGGGGGAGSGGAIFLEAVSLIVSDGAILCANGGSGGSGADGSSPGAHGALGTCDENTGSDTPDGTDAGGGGGGGFRAGNNGGDGANATSPEDNAGGGGGGSGVGMIRLRSAVQTLSYNDGATAVTPQPREN